MKMKQQFGSVQSSNPLDDPFLIKDVWILSKNYFKKGNFLFDMLSNVPPLVMIIMYDFVSTPELLAKA